MVMLEKVLQRLKDAEARIRQLEERQNAPPSTTTAAAAAVDTPPAPAAMAPDMSSHNHENALASGLQIRGFGDFSYFASDQKGATNSFVLGQFDLFMTSKLSDKWDFLAESVIQADSTTNTFGFEIERLEVIYHANEYFNVAMGRYHQTIGFYNTAFHHGTWFQTTAGRPLLFEFEDGGGILPIHNVGIAVDGKIPSGKLNLHYYAEIGNGRTSHSRDAEFVQNVFDENNRKSVNLALSARPEGLHGAQVGGSFLMDRLYPDGGPKVHQTIGSAYIAWVRPKYEILNEAVLVSNRLYSTAASAVAPGTTIHSTGFYSQVSHSFGVLRPYFRYEYLNVNHRDPIFYDMGRQSGPIFGLRWDAGEVSAFKVQFGQMSRPGLPSVNSVMGQIAFAF
jgi:hypothetical protein